MKHSGKSQILHVGGAAGDFGGNINACKGLADERIRARILEFRLRLRAHMRQVVADELAKGRAPTIVGHDKAIARDELIRGDCQLVSRTADQYFAHLRRCDAVPLSFIELLPAV